MLWNSLRLDWLRLSRLRLNGLRLDWLWLNGLWLHGDRSLRHSDWLRNHRHGGTSYGHRLPGDNGLLRSHWLGRRRWDSSCWWTKRRGCARLRNSKSRIIGIRHERTRLLSPGRMKKTRAGLQSRLVRV